MYGEEKNYDLWTGEDQTQRSVLFYEICGPGVIRMKMRGELIKETYTIGLAVWAGSIFQLRSTWVKPIKLQI